MPEVKFNARAFPLRQYESVLDCLLRHQQPIPYACKAGMCQACLVQAVNHDASEESRKWVKKSLQARGYTLACQWFPESDVEVALPAPGDFAVAAIIRSIDYLNEQVIRLRLDVAERGSMFHCYPGQYLSLINPQGVSRSYSLANDYRLDGCIELHIGRTSHGLFTGWLFQEARPGDRLHLRGPTGECFYYQEEQDGLPLLLAGTGTGLAPLYGIARDALRQGHRGPLNLIHHARDPARLYYVEELRALQQRYGNFSYWPTVSDQGAAGAGTMTASAEEAVSRCLDGDAAGRARVYLCGAPDFVHGLRKQVYLQGVRPGHIFTDPFIERTMEPQDDQGSA